ncbi:hypothetical protein BDY21DRAFT_359361 [Lineolata rhizophorae]|uniref:Uncharacterized protein n=1 Tax=Lineolata rhizophorae TaxID=578093 RepID=A0A6A6NL79_9PEZI|nr:hypothetical protein BDY21DRAFT_359361 [Lineolata rhizophorae]
MRIVLSLLPLRLVVLAERLSAGWRLRRLRGEQRRGKREAKQAAKLRLGLLERRTHAEADLLLLFVLSLFVFFSVLARGGRFGILVTLALAPAFTLALILLFLRLGLLARFGGRLRGRRRRLQVFQGREDGRGVIFGRVGVGRGNGGRRADDLVGLGF